MSSLCVSSPTVVFGCFVFFAALRACVVCHDHCLLSIFMFFHCVEHHWLKTLIMFALRVNQGHISTLVSIRLNWFHSVVNFSWHFMYHCLSLFYCLYVCGFVLASYFMWVDSNVVTVWISVVLRSHGLLWP